VNYAFTIDAQRVIDNVAAWAWLVRARAGNTCERCAASGCMLHAHHRNGRGIGKGDDHRLVNGECLCSPCHQHAHKEPYPAVPGADLFPEWASAWRRWAQQQFPIQEAT
jgi:hypothetical protein